MASAQYLLHGSWGDGRPCFMLHVQAYQSIVTEFLPTQHVQTQLDIIARGPGIGGSAPAAPPVNQGLPSYGIWWKSVGKQKF
jgi:hypothetical protein